MTRRMPKKIVAVTFSDVERMRSIWREGASPIVYGEGKGSPIKARVPINPEDPFEMYTTRKWLRLNQSRIPAFNPRDRSWTLPRSWLSKVTDKILRHYGSVYLIEPLRDQRRCAPKCWDAKRHDCECSCLGENHGVGRPDRDWYEISETFAVKNGPKKMACRLLKLA